MQYNSFILPDKRIARLLRETICNLQARNSLKIMLSNADSHLSLCKHYPQ